MHRLKKPASVLVLLGVMSIEIAACASASSTQAAPSGQALPRAERRSARDLQKGEGIDFCDRYPQPIIKPFRPGSGSPLTPLPGEPIRGADDAPVTLILYTDLQCPTCAQLAAALKTLLKRHPDDVRLVFRHYPLVDQYSQTQLAAEATLAAQAQGGDEAFWALVDLLYERQAEWSHLSEASLRDVLAGYAEELGLDADRLRADLEEGSYSSAVLFGLSSGPVMGVNAAPTLFINDTILTEPPVDVEVLDALVQDAILGLTYDAPPPMVIDPAKDYVAWIVTVRGDIAIDLYAELAPQTVNNFAYLACTGYYDDTSFHRVIPGFVAQGGDPTGSGFGGPGYTIPDEFENSGLSFDRAGWLSMAHTAQPDSAGSQFFITLGPTPNLNGAFTIFGQVVDGMDVVQALTPRDQSRSREILPPGDGVLTIIVRELEPGS